MKTALTFFLILVSVTLGISSQNMVPRFNKLTKSWASYPEVTIKDLSEVPFDSLLIADTLQNTIPSRWTLQTSPLNGDTVVLTALCVVPAKTLTFTAKGFTMLLFDTAATQTWRGLLARVNPADSAQIIADGFLNVERGDIIRITGVISEFPTTSMNSLTQFQPIAAFTIDIIGNQQIPPPISKTVPDFYTNVFPSGKVKYSTGEPYEGMIVELTNLTVDARVNTGRGTFSMVDDQGNQITMYDASRYFTLKGTSTDHPAVDPVWLVKYPNTGAKIDTIRGIITTVSGSENPRGYRIAPIYYGDIVFGIVLPSITTHRRNPIIVSSDSAANISVRALQQTGGLPVAKVELLYSLDNGPFISDSMAYQASDSTYHGQIPQQPENTFVHYFIKATDQNDSTVILASSAFGGASSDTSKGFFFYTVLNRSATIHDVQYTPYQNGRTGFLGSVVSLSGVVTADTGHIGISALNSGGTSAWYMQTGNEPSNGIWITGAESTLAALRNGDSVTVTGSVAENFDVTRIQNISSVTVHSSGNSLPDPVNVPTGAFGPTVGNGNPGAEPYEGMLVRFTNVRVSDIYPVFSDPTEFEVDDGSGPVIVRRDGINSFSNVEGDSIYGKTILRVGNRISSLTGVMYYSFNRYKVVPRTNADFGTVTGIKEEPIVGLPGQFRLQQNYPNPFNPSTVIEYTLRHAGYVSLKVYNLLGQEVASLVNETQEAGKYNLRFNGNHLSSGIYFYRLQAGEFTQIRKMVLIK